MALVAEAGGAPKDAPFLLVVDFVEVDDHDFGDGPVAEQRLQRAKPEHFIGHGLDQLVARRAAQLQPFLGDQLAGGPCHSLALLFGWQAFQAAMLELLDEQFVQPDFRRFELRVALRSIVRGSARSRPPWHDRRRFIGLAGRRCWFRPQWGWHSAIRPANRCRRPRRYLFNIAPAAPVGCAELARGP